MVGLWWCQGYGDENIEFLRGVVFSFRVFGICFGEVGGGYALY
jgi:hypothetical protein